MSYVWSPGYTLEVLSEVGVSSVRITSVNPTRPKVNETVYISASAALSSPVPTNNACVEFVLAVNSKSNIVASKYVRVSRGATGASVTFSTKFTQPGTYTIYVGARYWDICPA